MGRSVSLKSTIDPLMLVYKSFIQLYKNQLDSSSKNYHCPFDYLTNTIDRDTLKAGTLFIKYTIR